MPWHRLHVDWRPRLEGVIGSSITSLSLPAEQSLDSIGFDNFNYNLYSNNNFNYNFNKVGLRLYVCLSEIHHVCRGNINKMGWDGSPGRKVNILIENLSY